VNYDWNTAMLNLRLSKHNAVCQTICPLLTARLSHINKTAKSNINDYIIMTRQM